MTTPDAPDPKDNIAIGDVFRPLAQYRRVIWQGSVAVPTVAAILLAAYFFAQPTTWSAGIGFRPLFAGVSRMEYPNGTPFSPADIVNVSVVEPVYLQNGLQDYCELDRFRGGLVVQESSPELDFIILEFRSRLADTRLTSADRQRVEEEFAQRRASIARRYRLQFLRPADCSPIPDDIVFKVLSEVLETWATQSQEKRGVLNLSVNVLTPAIFGRPGDADEPLLVRADLLRTAISRVRANIVEVQDLPGASLIRGGESGVSFEELRAEFEDLQNTRLDPLVMTVARGYGRESAFWSRQALQSATVRLKAAERRVEALRTALREYSGVSTAPAQVGGRPADVNPSDVQALTPQIDRTFIDRIVEMSGPNVAFRQELTQRTLSSASDAVDRSSVVEYYRQLVSVASESAAAQISSEEANRRLNNITEQARQATRRFNELYAEFSRVALRIGTEMYRVATPAEASLVRSFTMRDYAFLLVGLIILTPLAMTIGCLLHYNLRRLFVGAR